MSVRVTAKMRVNDGSGSTIAPEMSLGDAPCSAVWAETHDTQVRRLNHRAERSTQPTLESSCSPRSQVGHMCTAWRRTRCDWVKRLRADRAPVIAYAGRRLALARRTTVFALELHKQAQRNSTQARVGTRSASLRYVGCVVSHPLLLCVM